MKKHLHWNLLVPAMAFCLSATAQSPRLQLLEYFDNTSIPPFGAVANANVDSLMINYSNKITCIKYHVAWGSQTGTDPMNLHNPGQVLTRVQYYNVVTDPHAKHDGSVPADSTFAGQPSGFKSSHILKRDTVSSPFIMNVSHYLNSAKDTIFTQTIIKKTGNTPVSSNPLVAHVVVLEKLVYFATPPGVSGDKVFHNVMKYMLPGDTGTVLPALNIGDSVIYNYSWKLANVYDPNQLCVVSFVQHQDSSYREVYQAGQSFPVPAQLDLAVNAGSNSKLNCDSLDQMVILKNLGVDTITSATLSYSIDGGTPQNHPWTGSLATGQKDTTYIHITGQTGGNHSIKIISVSPNGGTDLGPWTDTTTSSFAIAYPQTTAPLTESFQSTTFAPANWLRLNPDNGITWTQGLVGGFGYSNRSAKLAFYDIAAGNHDMLMPPPLNLGADTGSIYCVFSLAHAGYAAPVGDSTDYSDTLEVSVSTDCGASWTILYMKADTALKTAANTGNAFTPTAAQWKHQAVDLTAYVGQSNVQLRFVGRSGFGNNLYIDDINISHSSVSVGESSSISGFDVFPNPSNGRIELAVRVSQARPLSLIITNLVGETIRTISLGTSNGGYFPLNLEELPSGLYFITLDSGNGSETRKMMIRK